MLNGILEFAELFKQFVLTGMMVMISVALVLTVARTFFAPNEWWVHASIAAMVLLMVVFPNGWQALVGAGNEEIDWDALRSGIPYISPGTKFEADLAGGLIGSAIAYALCYYFDRRRHW